MASAETSSEVRRSMTVRGAGPVTLTAAWSAPTLARCTRRPAASTSEPPLLHGVIVRRPLVVVVTKKLSSPA